MRMRGFRKSMYLLTCASPELDRRLLQLSHSLTEVKELLKKPQKNVKKS